MKNRFKKIYKRARKAIAGQRLEPNSFFSRPFRREEFRALPDGWKIQGPHFLGIASVRAGTSWWYHLITEHPGVVPNRLGKKELSYFQHFGFREMKDADFDFYREAFAAPEGRISGEWSPGYLTYPNAIVNVVNAAPRAKFIALLRNPVDRVWSAMNQASVVRLKAMGIKKSGRYVFSTYSLLPEVVFGTYLYRPFKCLLNLIKREQILVLQYEKCIASPEIEIARTFRFLGLDDSFKPRNLYIKNNVMPNTIEPYTTAERMSLARYFSEDVNGCVELFPDLDLSLWPDFKINQNK